MTMIKARYFGPKFAGTEPHQIVIHSVESGIVAGLGRALAAGYWQEAGNETSAHNIADPSEAVDMVPDDERAWHCGNGNATSWGKEHTGRAAFTRAQWTTPAGLKMLRNSAVDAARRCRLHDIPPRWLSLTQLARDEKGFCTHNDMRLVRGGTTHTDPGRGFPYDLYLDYVKDALEASGEAPNPIDTGDDDMDGSKKVEATDYRGRFTNGDSPQVDYTLEKYLVNGWEFIKYCAGRLDQLAGEMAELQAAVKKLGGGK